MDLEERLNLVTREPTEEIVTRDELANLFLNVSVPKHYIGIEISGSLHLGSLILTGYKINDFIRAGVDCTLFLADWHTYINNKLKGDWSKINRLSKYYAEAFKFVCPGLNIVLGSKMYQERGYGYWTDLILFGKHLTLARTMRSLTIMGRTKQDSLDFSQLLYPSMQSIDIKSLGSDIVHAGMDQRKIHMLAREIFPKMGWKTPVAVHHHLLPGLSQPGKSEIPNRTIKNTKLLGKMSKSSPDGSILVHDDVETINRKVGMAYCPTGIAKNNPILELVRYIILHDFSEFEVERASKYGGTVSYHNYAQLENDFEDRRLHPADLKRAVSIYLNKILDPVRKHFKGREPLSDN
jgi:tyrosyl-tRNA synthetase